MDKTVLVLLDFGEVGIDPEASPGNGEWYVKLYDGSFDVVGLESLDDAVGELLYAYSLKTMIPEDGGWR